MWMTAISILILSKMMISLIFGEEDNSSNKKRGFLGDCFQYHHKSHTSHYTVIYPAFNNIQWYS